MKLSKTILAAALAASMVGAAGFAYAQSTGGGTTNLDGTSTGSNNPGVSPQNPGGATGGTPGVMDSRGRMNNNRGMQGGGATNRDGTSNNPMNRSGAMGAADIGGAGGTSGAMDSSGRMNERSGMRNRSMRDGATGASGQASDGVAAERRARADRN